MTYLVTLFSRAWKLFGLSFIILTGSSWLKAEIVGLWQFDEGTIEATRSWSTFGQSSRGKVVYDEARVGKGAYSAVHGENTNSDWRHHATASIGLLNHAQIDGEKQVGLAVWLRPMQAWSKAGRLISFRRDGFGIAAVEDQDGHFRIVNPGLIDEAALPTLMLPMNEWSHVALTANGREVSLLVNGEVLARLPQTGTFNAADRLYLGAMDTGGVGLYGTYVDELVLYRGATDEAWAREIYEKTSRGEPLEVEVSPLAEFQPVERDPSAFLKLSEKEVALYAGQRATVNLKARETPLFGGFISPRLLTGEKEVLKVIDDLKAHNCNTLVTNMSWCRQRPELLKLFHEHEFRVFVMVSPPYGGDLVREIPETAQRAVTGDTVRAASFHDPRMIDHLNENFLADGLEGRGMDGVILDEPSMPGYRNILKDGELYHWHPADQEAYKKMFGEAMPVTNIRDAIGPEERDRLIAFRQRTMEGWLKLIENVFEKRARGVDYHVVLTPDNVLTGRRRGGLTPAEATAIDVEKLLESETLKGIQLTAYLNAWGVDSAAWVEQFLPLFLEKAHEHGKASIIWAQAYLESPGQVKRGIAKGHIGELIERTVGAGADGIFLWHYRGFSQDGYGWSEFFKEFSDAAARYQNRVAEGLVFTVEPANAGLFIEVTDLGSGDYRLNFQATKVGQYNLKVRNRGGIVQTLPVVVK